MPVLYVLVLVLLPALAGAMLVQQLRLRSELERWRRSSVITWRDLADRLAALERRLLSEDPSPNGGQARSPSSTPPAPPPGSPVPEAVPHERVPDLHSQSEAWTGAGPAGSGSPPAQIPRRPGLRSSARNRWGNLELAVGRNWLQKLGVGVLVVGVSLLLGYTFAHLGPVGKLAIGYLVAGSLILVGRSLETRTGLMSYGRGLIGGGWALLYFTTYALHFVPATRILESPLSAFLLPGIVVGGMIRHSLVYRSQAVTGLAYVLGFVTVTLSQGPFSGAAATLALSGSLVWICTRLNWTGLLLLGAAATHASEAPHVLRRSWLHGGALTGGEAAFGMMVFSLSWGLFLLPNFDSGALTARKQLHRQLTNLVNGGFLVGLAGITLPTRVSLFWFLLGAGGVYLTLAAWSRGREDSEGQAVFTLLGGGIWVAAAPLRFSGHWLSWIWLLESQAFLVAGFRLNQRWLRRLSWASLALLVGKLLLLDVFDRSGFRFAGVLVYDRSVLFFVTAGCLYASRFLLGRSGQDRNLPVLRFFTYPAALLVAWLSPCRSRTGWWAWPGRWRPGF